MPVRHSLRRANFSARGFVTFLCVGGACTAVHYLVMLLLMRAGLQVMAASSIGFLLSALLNYLLNEQLTFHSDEPRLTAPRFAIVAFGALVMNYLLLAALIRAGLPTAPAQLLTTLGVIVWNYSIHGAWTFTSNRRD